MPAYNIAGSDRFGQGIVMPGMDLADPAWTITIHDRPLLKAHKQLPRRRDHSFPSIDLRSHYKKTQLQFSNGGVYPSRHISTTPPDPPETLLFKPSQSPIPIREPSEHGRDDSSNAETTILRSRVATPTYQKSPPTPDMTPPRPDNLLLPRVVLANAPSVSSRAESFKTAREELSSDDEVDSGSPSQLPSRQRWLQNSQVAQMQDWRIQPSPIAQIDGDYSTPTRIIKRKPLPTETFATFDGTWEEKVEDSSSSIKGASSLNGPMDSTEHGDSLRSPASHPSPLPTPPHSAGAVEISATPEPLLQRGKSLRDRVQESNMVRASDSTENFARDIGWSNVYKSPGIQNRINSWRLSGISTTSTIEAIVVDAETPPQRQQQLRHSRKNASLRSASSPFPTSNRSSLLSNPESPHRLVRKKGKITNKSRWSIGSEASRTTSVSFAIANPPKPEVIQVAVIPERKSSLQSSESSSRRHSASLSMSSTGHHAVAGPDHSLGNSHAPIRKKRAMSASSPARASSESRGRDWHIPHAIPQRGSSLSAPTSRSNSRANSLTSEHFRLRRLAAEEDLHRTLERMESERSVIPRYNGSHTRKGSSSHAAESDNEAWDALRSPSLYTPFSPPSMESASPGPVEMGQARAVNLFAHNNHSLQIVDQNPQPESRAVMFLQGSGGKGRLPLEDPSTPKETSLPQLIIDSPLRNPRDPPQPPTLQIIPPTPSDLTPVDDNDRQLGLPFIGTPKRAGSLSRRFGSLRRPTLGTRRHSESFFKSLSRTLSLRGARNMRADQTLDANLHPLWRPRGFWDDITDSDSERDHYDGDVVVSNSLGVPQRKTIIDGPISLVRHLSDSSRRHRRTAGVTKRSSYGSLSRSRTGNKMSRIPGLGHRLPFLRLQDMQNRLQLSKRKKEDEERERTRQTLREKIGPQIISTGDSRYPTYMPPAAFNTERTGGLSN
jgi:hypothetical protein